MDDTTFRFNVEALAEIWGIHLPSIYTREEALLLIFMAMSRELVDQGIPN